MKNEPQFKVLPGGRAMGAPAGLFARELPHSAEAESYLLACCFLDGREVLAKCAAWGVRPAAFADARHGVVFDCMARLVERGVQPEVAVVAEQLGVEGKLKEAGGVEGLMVLSQLVPTVAQAEFFIERVKTLWARRHAILLGGAFVEKLFGLEDADATRALAVLSGELGQKLITFGHKQEVRSLVEQVQDVTADARLRLAGQADRSRWLPTMLPLLDAMCGQLGAQRTDHFHLLAAASSDGKSTFFRGLVWQWIKLGRRVLVYSVETNVESFIEQLAASAASVDLEAMEGTPQDRAERFLAELKWLEEEVVGKLLWVVHHSDAQPLVTVGDLERHYRAFENLHGAPAAVIVDYLQLLEAEKKTYNREQEVNAVTNALRSLCRRSGNQWIIGAQFSASGTMEQRVLKRDGEGRVIHRIPSKMDLAESKQMFNAADRVYALYRPPEDSAGAAQDDNTVRPEIWVCVIKKRSGRKGRTLTRFVKQFTRFEEFTREQIRAAEDTMQKAAPRTDKAAWRKGG